jgi:hypothetical protein
MAMNPLTTQLYRAWSDAVAAGEVANQFIAPQDDVAGRWAEGDRVIYGIRLVKDDFAFYAQNLDQSRQIDDSVEEKFVEDTGFICQFNGYRALRPGLKRSQPGRQPTLSAKPADCRFFCEAPDKPLSLISRRPLMQVPLGHYLWNAYYNAAPIEKAGHFLWVPVSQNQPTPVLPHFPQVLTLEFLQDAIALFRKLDKSIVFFNGLGAGASVNHIHIQSAYHRHPIALEKAPLTTLTHCTILGDYLAPGIAFPADAPPHYVFQWVERLQRYHIPHNLVMVADRIVLFPRNIDHEVISELPTDRPGSPAFWGKLLTANRQTFAEVTPDILRQAFQKMGLPATDFAELVSHP